MRKRPLNKKELARKEDDIVSVCDDASLTVHEPKLKVPKSQNFDVRYWLNYLIWLLFD